MRSSKLYGHLVLKLDLSQDISLEDTWNLFDVLRSICAFQSANPNLGFNIGVFRHVSHRFLASLCHSFFKVLDLVPRYGRLYTVRRSATVEGVLGLEDGNGPSFHTKRLPVLVYQFHMDCQITDNG